MVVGIVQAYFNKSPTDNLAKASSIIMKRFREADIVILPEYSMVNPFIFLDSAEVYGLSEDISSSRYLIYLEKIASKLNTIIVAHFIERTNIPPLTKNTSVLVSANKIIPVYSKMHLFDVYSYRESDFFKSSAAPGDSYYKNFKLSFTICYDLRFPELFRFYAAKGTDTVIVQAGWVKGPLKEEILDVLASARAHESTVCIVLANQTGDMFTGRSGVFNPWGYKELDMDFDERYAEYTLNIEEVEKARSALPVVHQAVERWEVKIR
ncbi:MAG: nitrilase-related carbon-nitrogen hydrolase [Ignisphaera sp.]